jgi:hypothetical protein
MLRLDREDVTRPPTSGAFWQVLPDLNCGRAGPKWKSLMKPKGRQIGPDFLISFAWLYLNALLREARKVNPHLPQLSSYF